MKTIRVGVAMCASFCTFATVLPEIEGMVADGFDVMPIMSETAASTDTRFGRAEDFVNKLESICLKKVVSSIVEAESIGPMKLLDILVIAPCTGNTLGKLANGITDSSVTMAAKAHLRNARPLLLGISTNDALGAGAQNIGRLMNAKNIFFVPMRQDDPGGKPCSLVANMTLVRPALRLALSGSQMQPLYV